MEFSLSQIAHILEGNVEGDDTATVNNLCKIEEGVAGGLSFLANPKYTPYIYKTEATAVIVNQTFVPEKPIKTTLIRVPDAYQAFAKLLAFYEGIQQSKSGISSLAFIHSRASLGDNCYVGEFVVIGENVKIGSNAKIYPHVYIGENTVIGNDCALYAGVKLYKDSCIGNRVTIHAGSVIGTDGFGFAPNDGTYSKIAQIGNVVIEDDVEIGANTCVDRATMGSTVIKRGVKLDNLIQIGHNVVVGEDTVMASQVGVSGSTKVGKRCMLGGQVGLAGHLVVADGVKIAAQSGVPSSLKTEDGNYFGTPAIDAATFRRSSIHFRNFDTLVKRLNELERQVNELNAKV
ncbi:UDP-3-O-acylglucosamine N-acyltransferase [Bacteroidia bacterium]|nr:UDP-3-O-acylglucosamine N-acyltransferase [Bacteroidia bacterium]